MLPAFHGPANVIHIQRCLVVEFCAKDVTHQFLTDSCRKQQELQVFPSRNPVTVFLLQPVIGDTEIADRKHFFTVLVVLECTGLPDEAVNDMPVVDQAFFTPDQAWHPLHFLALVANDDFIHVNHAVHMTADQTTMNGIRILLQSDHTAAADSDSLAERAMVKLLQRQFVEMLLLQGKFVPASDVPLIHNRLQKLTIGGWCRKVAAAAKHQCLLDSRLEVTMRRFDISILVSLTNIDAMRNQAIVIHQLLITTSQFMSRRQIVDCGAQTVCSMPIRNASHLPDRSLKSIAQRLKRFRKANRH